MRLIKILLGVASAALAIGIFGYFSRLPDEAAYLHPYVKTDQTRYLRTTGLGDTPVYIRVRYLEVDGATMNQLTKMITTISNPKVSCRLRYDQTISLNSTAAVETPLSAPHIKGLQIERVLTWNQVLWVRLTHLGADPFRDRNNG